MNSHVPHSVSRRRLLGGAVAFVGSGSLELLSGARRAVAAGPIQVAQAPAVVRSPRKITMRCATIVAESFPYVDGLRRWKQLVEDRTAGTVEMQIFHTAQLGDERTINEGILAGS